MSHLLTPDMRKWHEELERFRADLAALRRRAEQAERERDEARELVRKQFKAGDWFDKEPLFYDAHELARDAIERWDACEARTAAAPHGDAAHEAEQEAQTHYP